MSAQLGGFFRSAFGLRFDERSARRFLSEASSDKRSTETPRRATIVHTTAQAKYWKHREKGDEESWEKAEKKRGLSCR